MSTKTTFTFTDSDGYEIFVYKWSPAPEVSPKAAVQIAHGAAEHALRYEHFAKFLNTAGYIVYANDHRGHGKTAGTLERAGLAGQDGWNGIMRDAKQLTGIIKDENPGIPLFFFGHSMGSMIAQRYMQLWGDEATGAVLSGTFGSLSEDIEGTVALAEQMVQEQGPDAPSALFAGMFAAFNEPFSPGKTGFEWLSRDQVEVQKYVDDPWCGFPFSNSLVADLFKGGEEMWKPENEARIPKTLPIFAVSGDKDPAGAFTASVTLLLDRYAEYGLANVTHKFYPDARHEILNEINRDEVQQDILDWLESQMN
jgi:alpha-beta hydrolase superfamily lysophospholipase